MHHQNIRGIRRFLFGKGKEDCPNKDAAEYRQRDQARRQHNAHRNRPEQEGDIHGLFDRGAEPDNGQSAHHAQRQHDVAHHRHNQQGGNKRQSNQCYTEAGRIHHAAVALFIDEKDKQSQQKGQYHGNHHVQYGDGGDILQKAGFENILKGHKALPPQIILIEPPAQGVFGAGRRLPSGYLHRHADKLRQKCIVFDFQHRSRLHGAHVENRRIQEVHISNPGADIPI